MNTLKHALGLDHDHDEHEGSKRDDEQETGQSDARPEPAQSLPAQSAQAHQGSVDNEPKQDERSAESYYNKNDDGDRRKLVASSERHHAPSVSTDAMKGNIEGSHLEPGEIPCPDPSVHQHNTQLQEQASRAALSATHPEPAASVHGNWPLDANNKLSSAGAATSLRHARPQDLPSFPVVGIDTQSSAGKAAMLAKDYKMAPLWRPEGASAAGSKAALLAAKEGPKLNLWMPEPHAEGNSAANIAMRMKGLSPQLDYGYTPEGHRRALLAATGALSNSQRRRAGSNPTPVELYPDQANAKYNALNAATSSARDANRLGSAAMEAARVRNLGRNMPREMFTEHPPVAIEVEEKKHQDALRASAVSMAKQMYALTQRQTEGAAGADGRAAAVRSQARQSSTANQDIKQQAMQYINLQEHAQKLAAERLAKLEPDGTQAYRQYYGYSMDSPRSRLSLRGRGRRRASSESGLAAADDEEQSRKIRSQMSQFNTQLAQVDAKKQRADRESLLAVAERRVQARMHDLDEKVFMETGKVPPAMMEEWERKARERAAADSEARMVNHGKVHVGGGKFMDQSEIDAIAAARLQPTLDEITEKAERQRALDEERRLDEEQRKRDALKEKQRAAETKAEQKRVREEEKRAEKARKREGKLAAKTEKEAERARKAEEKRMQGAGQRESTELEKVTTTEPEADSKPSSDVDDTARATDTGVVAARSRGTSIISQSVTGSEAEAVAHRVLTAPVVSKDVPDILPTTEDGATTVVDKAAAEELLNLKADPSEVERVPAAVSSSKSERALADEPITIGTAVPATAPPTAAAVAPTAAAPAAAPAAIATTAPTSQQQRTRAASPPKTESKGLKSLLGKFKRRSKASASTPTTTATESSGRPSSSFVGGAALTGVSSASSNDNASPGGHSTRGASTTQASSAPITTAAAATTAATGAAAAAAAATHSRASSPSVSSLSSSSLEDDEEEAPRGRPGRRFSDSSDEFEEARDTFDDRLAPPPSLGGRGSKTESPVRDSKFQEAL